MNYIAIVLAFLCGYLLRIKGIQETAPFKYISRKLTPKVKIFRKKQILPVEAENYPKQDEEKT